ncbi:MAG: CHAT domain-containing protein [Desulfobacterales bacterium]
MPPHDPADKFSRSGEMTDILLERERLEQVLKDRFRRKVTILFSDIAGYTDYVDKHGDIGGRALLVKHNKIVLPAVDRHRGRLIEVVGDGVMASFDEPLDAVKTAVSIQLGLQAHNQNNEDEIHVKIGINIGQVLVDKDAAFQRFTGNVANVAARIAGHADSDGILITETVHEEVCGCEDILCRFHDRLTIKGKSLPVPVYRVLWQEGDFVTATVSRGREPALAPLEKPTPPARVFHLELTQEGPELKISAHENVAGDESTLRHYEKSAVDMTMVNSRCRDLVDLLNKANRRGWVPREALAHLREIGQILYDELLTLSIKERLRNTPAESLVLAIDDQLVHIPWELLYDGRQFLCQRFEMGRVVTTSRNFPGSHSRALAVPLRMLILADPTGDLKGAYAEGTQIRDFIDQNRTFVRVSLRADHVSADVIKGKLRNFDFIHFAGHADYQPQNSDDSGWRLRDSRLSTKDIIKMAGTTTMPAMIFANACQSGRTEQWTLSESFENNIFELANAFLLAGVKHYIGTFWEILDEQSNLFALEFYRHLFSDISVGQALNRARKTYIELHGEESIVWASYVLYGDPSYNYMGQLRMSGRAREPRRKAVASHSETVRAGEEVIKFTSSADKTFGHRRWLAAGMAFFTLAAMLWGYLTYDRLGLEKKERQALAHYKAGDLDTAIKVCSEVQGQEPQRPFCSVLLGNIHLTRGDTAQARTNFQRVFEDEKALKPARVEAVMGLGRLSSIDDQPQKALEYYQQAARLEPRNTPAVVAQATVNERLDHRAEALRLYEQVLSDSPDDPAARAAAASLREKMAWDKDVEKRRRIDDLIRELTTDSSPKGPAEPSDGWTSPPLTAWLLNFETKGFGLVEGEEILVENLVAEELMARSRVRIVERALMDRLLEELRLGASNLADPATAAALGRLVSAKILLSGRIVHHGSATRVAVRIIETETGLVTAVVNASFDAQTAPPEIAGALVAKLADEFSARYPLRGKIVAIENDAILLDVGSLQGAAVGQRFAAVNADATLEVVSVEKDRCKTMARSGRSAVEPGSRVQITSHP